MDKALRNNLRLTVTQCRKLLEDSITEVLQGQFGLHRDGAVEDIKRLGALGEEDLAIREHLIAHLRHIEAAGFKPAEAAAQLIREVAFTHLNRLCAFKLMEHPERKLIRETIGRGLNSNGFKFYLVEHPDDERHWSSGRQDVAYRHFLVWQGAQLSAEIGVLFAPEDPANRLFPKQAVLDQVLTLLNDPTLADIWGQDETIGWIYQYFTPKELRDQARKESSAPRNSYELAFRNQFFTPRYVVEFLADNTLGRTWYEMLQGDSVLLDRCRYLVRRPSEIFQAPGQLAPATEAPHKDLSQEELLRQPVYILHRPRKDPRDLRILDPAAGSGHFLLYSFDLLLSIYEEAWSKPDGAPAWFVSGKALHEDYPTLVELRRAAPGLILRHNLYGVDIDLRATQIAGLALWLRAQRAYQEQGLKANERLPITRVNMVCAEPMPGERALLDEFVQELEPAVLGQLVRVVFERMKLAGEAGSLLKIEEELRDAIETAKRQWKARPRAEQLTLFPEERRAIAEQLTIYDVAQISDEAFWGEAEARVLEALQQYAERAANGQGYRRRLFAGDAARGFAFIDVCQRRYDVVLMNPPFGDLTPLSRPYVRDKYPISSNDIYCAFLERCRDLAVNQGKIGAITPRSCFYLSQLSMFRQTMLLGDLLPDIVVDLGENVLDMAVNEVASYVISLSSGKSKATCFIRALTETDKGNVIQSALDQLRSGKRHSSLYLNNTSMYSLLKYNPFVYWVESDIIRKLSALPSFEPTYGTVRQGLATTDDMRFIRLPFEVSPDLILSPPNTIFRSSHLEYQRMLVDQSFSVGRWAFHVKSGSSQPWYSPLTCLIDWKDNGLQIKAQRQSRRQHAAPSENYYFLPGFSWTRRAVRLMPYIVPAGAIPSASRYEGFPDESVAFEVLGIMASNMASAFARFYGEKFVWPNFLVDNVRSVPFPRSMKKISILARTFVENAVTDRRNLYRCYEPFQEFTLPTIFSGQVEANNSTFNQLQLLPQSLEKVIQEEIGIDSDQYNTLLQDLLEALLRKDLASGDEDEGSEEETSDQEILLDNSERAKNEMLISYLVGVTMGRWDVRFALDANLAPQFSTAFAPLPVVPPGTLVAPDGLPATSGRIVSEEWLRARPDAISLPPEGSVQQPTIPDKEYPLRIDWDGILVDDPDHEDDIVRRVRAALDVIFGERAEAIEREACQILGVDELRDYFRRPGKGGFWDDHIKRYSKSRRKAPIYWLLQSPKKHYALWLYYHRLDKDTLFKAQVTYVEPKIRLERERLSGMQSHRAGLAGRELRQLEREIERQEVLISDLEDFRDRLVRAAQRYLEPDHNDGVVLTIAPLWELVPWKEAKQYWNELLAGKYEWSGIGKQLRAKGLVK